MVIILQQLKLPPKCEHQVVRPKQGGEETFCSFMSIMRNWLPCRALYTGSRGQYSNINSLVLELHSKCKLQNEGDLI